MGVAPCGIGLTTEGGTFTPTTCGFRIVTPGVPCGNGEACAPGHVLALVDTDRTHIQQVALFQFAEYAARTFTYDPTRDLSEVQGQAVDTGSVVRNLETATVTLEPQKNSKVHATFDATFSNGIHVRGDGVLPVIMENAP